MLQDPKIRAAVSKIMQRSERQDDKRKLLGTYVDIGLLPQLDNRNHQILYGRRGTGKTHVLRVLESRLREDTTNAVVYIDCRTLGSTSQFGDTELSMRTRCLALFRDVLLAMYHGLMEHIIEFPSKRGDEALDEADFLQRIITEPIAVMQADAVKHETSDSRSETGGVNFKISAKDPSAGGSLGIAASAGWREETAYSVKSQDKVIFPELQRALSKVLGLAECRIMLLIDEWSSLPRDVQPYLAEFLKRGLVPVTRATLKIGALEHRSTFTLNLGTTMVGFELGADVSTAPDLDDYFVYDRNPERIVEVYADVLYRHLATGLPADYLRGRHRIGTSSDLPSRMFTEWATCAELARAAEGVIRDLINIFTQAYFHADRRGRETIDRKAVLESARQWFEQDKAQYLDPHLNDVLRRIVDDVIGLKKARSFLLPRALEKHPTVQKLFDSRILHLMQRGYADKSNPGLRYNIYTIDYGAYVDLINTSKQPQIELIDVSDVEVDAADIVVPFDDKRSIRRIVLDESIL